MRHLGVAGHPAVHGVDTEPLRDQCGQVPGGHPAPRVLQEAPVEKARLHHDNSRVDQLGTDHCTTHVRMVRNTTFAYSQLEITLSVEFC